MMKVSVIEVSEDQLDAPWALCVCEDRAVLLLRKSAEVPTFQALLRIA